VRKRACSGNNIVNTEILFFWGVSCLMIHIVRGNVRGNAFIIKTNVVCRELGHLLMRLTDFAKFLVKAFLLLYLHGINGKFGEIFFLFIA